MSFFENMSIISSVYFLSFFLPSYESLNTLNTTYARAKAANVDINSIGKVIDFDIIHHKAGDTFITPWGDSIKFKHDCTQVIINGYE